MMHLLPPPKIPGECKCCKRPLSKSDMESYLRMCDKTGKNPLDAARGPDPGILCSWCFMRAVIDTTDDADVAPEVRKTAQQFVSLMRRNQLGMTAVKKRA